MSTVICDSCKQLFAQEEQPVMAVESGDLSVRYFSCPCCGTKYQIITIDPQMRRLISDRMRWQKQIKIAHAKKFSEKTIRRYEREIEKIKKEQMRILPALKARGEEILQQFAQEGPGT